MHNVAGSTLQTDEIDYVWLYAENVGVTRPTRRTLLGKIMCVPAPNTKPSIKFEVSSSSSFGAIDAAMADMTLNDI